MAPECSHSANTALAQVWIQTLSLHQQHFTKSLKSELCFMLISNISLFEYTFFFIFLMKEQAEKLKSRKMKER